MIQQTRMFADHVRRLARLSEVTLIPFVDSMGNEEDDVVCLMNPYGGREYIFNLGLGDNIMGVRLDPDHCAPHPSEVVEFAITKLREMDASRQADLAELERLVALPSTSDTSPDSTGDSSHPL